MTVREFQFNQKKVKAAEALLLEIKRRLIGFKEKSFFQKIAAITGLVSFLISEIDNFEKSMNEEETTLLAETKLEKVLGKNG